MVKNGEIYLSKLFDIYVGDNYFELQNIYIYMCVNRYRPRDLKSFLFFNWTIVALQCFVSPIQQSESAIYIHISPLFFVYCPGIVNNSLISL